MRVRVRRRLLGMLLAATVLYFFATNSQVVWLYLLTAMILALVPIGLAGPFFAARRMSARVERLTPSGFAAPLAQDRGRVFADDDVQIVLSHTGHLDMTDLSVAGQAVEVHDAGPARLTIHLAPAPRGRQVLKTLAATTGWPLGLLTLTQDIPLGLEIVRHPRYFMADADRGDQGRDLMGATAVRGTGEEFLGVREYRPGDSRRRVHWPTTARAGGLMVVETAQEAQAPARFRLDVDRDATAGALDLAASVAASLTAGCVATGRAFSLAVADRPLATTWGEAIGRLATVDLGAARSVPGRRPAEAVRVAAGRGVVRLESAQGAWVLEVGASEAAVREAAEAVL